MSINLLPLSWVGPIVSREGKVGGNALTLLPFYGFWSPSGKVYSFPQSQTLQNTNPYYGPVPMPDTYSKGGCCDCSGALPVGSN